MRFNRIHTVLPQIDRNHRLFINSSYRVPNEPENY